MGQGENDQLKNLNYLNNQVEYLRELLSELKIDKASFVGISNGARVALLLAQYYPKAVERVFVADTYSKLDESIKFKLESWLAASKVGGNELRFQVSTPWIFGDTFLKNKPEVLEYFLESVKDKDQRNSELLIESALEDITIELDKITAPVHFLVGSEDRLTPIEIHENMMLETKNGTLDILKGGHASLLEYPENIKNFILPKFTQESL